MELLFFFGAMAIFFAVVFAREAYSAKKREKKFIDSLYTDYGNVPDKEYAIMRSTRKVGMGELMILPGTT